MSTIDDYFDDDVKRGGVKSKQVLYDIPPSHTFGLQPGMNIS